MANQSKSLSPNGNGLANGSLSSSPEKPLHYTYLKGFRVEQCALFLQHKCTNHKPFTCFDWHFQNQRRRRPVRRRDGTFNYSPDTYCTKYDETTGICPDKDDCPYLHKTAGDTERRYHLRYYKTGICVYETDSRGYCSKNGKHCAFAHGAQDLRNPVFDVRELQTLENGNSGVDLMDTVGGSNNLAAGTSIASTSIDRERNALLEDPRWNETAYVLANYKTVLCKRPPRFCRQGYACPQYHNGKDRRRSPKIFKYRSTPCPNTKQGDEWVDPSKCEQGDQCPYCHSRTEQQFHPEIFKSTKCKDIQDTGYCPRGAFCAFAHTEDEMVATRDIDLDKLDLVDETQSEMSSSYPGENLLARSYNQAQEDLNKSLEQIRQPAFNNLSSNNVDDDDDIFSSSEMRRLSSRNDNIILGSQDSSSETNSIVNNLLGIDPVIKPSSKNLGPIARPRSYSHSQARTVNTDFNQLHAALARARMIDELKMAQTFAVNNDYSSNLIGFRERAVHSFSISSATPPVSALDFLPSSRLTPSNLTLDDLNVTGNNSLGNQSKSLSPNGNGLANGSLSSSPEKPLHYTYLKGFRVEQCALFLQHKCTNHKPFTCFDWHFQNQRRRRPVRRRDGTFNYSPDTYCTKYDETTGICPDKDDCPYLHKTAGDTERRYHLRYYKTGICVYETDSRGYCSKNGKHCAFAHGAQDLRNPVFDVRELQTLDNGNSSGELSDTACLTQGTSVASTSIDRERNALLEDPRWNETAYVLANYKTVLCKRPPRFCRQGYACPQYHNGKDRRRSPKIFKYRSTPCPNTKQGDEWVDPSKCEQGDQCPYCHSRTEQQFHPEIFKSTKCKDIQDTGYCPRGAFCAFAHTEDEMVATRDIDLDKLDFGNLRAEMSQSYPGESLLVRNYQANEDLNTLGGQLNRSLERMRPFNNLDDDDDDDIFRSRDMRRLSDRNDNIILGAQDSNDADTIVNNLLGIESVIRNLNLL